MVFMSAAGEWKYKVNAATFCFKAKSTLNLKDQKAFAPVNHGGCVLNGVFFSTGNRDRQLNLQAPSFRVILS